MSNAAIPEAPPKDVSGIDQLRAMIADDALQPPISRTLGFKCVEAEEGRVVFAGEAHAGVHNPYGAAHGGWYGVMLDSAMSCAIFSTMPPGRLQTTIEYKVNILRPATAATGLMRAEGWILRVGRRIAAAEGRVIDAEGRVYATGSTNCMVFDL